MIFLNTFALTTCIAALLLIVYLTYKHKQKFNKFGWYNLSFFTMLTITAFAIAIILLQMPKYSAPMLIVLLSHKTLYIVSYLAWGLGIFNIFILYKYREEN